MRQRGKNEPPVEVHLLYAVAVAWLGIIIIIIINNNYYNYYNVTLFLTIELVFLERFLRFLARSIYAGRSYP